jgi:hypothetical protein
MMPSYENMLLNSTEYATSEVTQGRNTAVRSRPRNFRFGMFRHEAMTSASTIMKGTWMNQEDEGVGQRPVQRSGRSTAGTTLSEPDKLHHGALARMGRHPQRLANRVDHEDAAISSSAALMKAQPLTS